MIVDYVWNEKILYDDLSSRILGHKYIEGYEVADKLAAIGTVLNIPYDYFKADKFDCFVYLIGSSHRRHTDRAIDRPTDQPTDLSIDRLINRPTDRPTDQPTDQPNDRPTDQPTDLPKDRPPDRST